MRVYLLSLVTAAFTLTMLACQPAHLQEPTPVDYTNLTLPAQIPANPVDSTQTVQFPDVKVVAAQSITPKGALDQLIRYSSVQYSTNLPGYVNKDTTITQFFYNAAGQIIGYQNRYLGATVEPQNTTSPSAYGTIYEYRNNRPYRIYIKAYDSMVRPYLDLFFMSQFGYANEADSKPRFKWDYGVSPTGKARLSAQSELVYDKAGNLIESKDVNKHFIHQRYTYQGANIVKTETIDPNPMPIQFSYNEYEYDKHVNPTKGLYWDGNYDYTEFTINANNVIQQRTINSSPSIQPYIRKYTLGYDSQGRVVSRSTVNDSGRTQWLYHYGQ